MAAEKKSWNAMDAKEQDDRRKEERLMKRLENSTGVNRDLVIKKILEEKDIKNPNAYRAEIARLNNLASNFDVKQERELKKSYENKWSQSSAGIQASVENQRIRQELSDYNYNLSNNRTQMSYLERQELNRKKLELQNQLRFSDAQLGENKNSWISQTQAEDDRLTAYNEQKDQQEYVESKYGKGFQGDPGGYATGKTQMQVPRQPKQARQPQQGKGQPKGMPQEMVQSPAMAQKRMRTLPYEARTGRSLSDTELNNFHRNDAALYRQVGGTPMGGSSQNPYLMSNANRSIFEANSKYQTAIDDARKPKFGMSNWNY